MGSRLEKLDPAFALHGDPADGAVPLSADLHPQLLPLLLCGAVYQLHDLADGHLPDHRGALDLRGLVEGRGPEAVEVGRPGLQVVALQRDPADGAVAQRPSLDSDGGRDQLLLGSLEGLQRLALLERSDHVRVRAGKLLLQRDVFDDGVVLRAGLGIDRPSIALDGDPALLVVLHGLPLHARNAGILVVDGAFKDGKDLATVQLPHDVAILDVHLVRHCNGRDARVVLPVRLCEDGASRVLDREPARGAVADGLGAHTDHGGVGLLPGALKELDHLVDLQGADLVIHAAIKGALHDNLCVARVVRLLHLLQEGRALISVHCDPPLLAVYQGLALHPRQSDLVVRAGALEHLDDLVGIGLTDCLGLTDLKVIRDGDGFHNDEVLLQERQELSPANATHLNVLAQQLGMLRLDLEVGHGLEVLAEDVR
mmetsp:Transcript_94983/g.252229  ORF Transcript_94983/g.252229 Transcript_94983/m.252229 type:complete len:426 (+) Transcript_94983:261-1538(+)